MFILGSQIHDRPYAENISYEGPVTWCGIICIRLVNHDAGQPVCVCLVGLTRSCRPEKDTFPYDSGAGKYVSNCVLGLHQARYWATLVVQRHGSAHFLVRKLLTVFPTSRQFKTFCKAYSGDRSLGKTSVRFAMVGFQLDTGDIWKRGQRSMT